jgi:hypothetical protein
VGSIPYEVFDFFNLPIPSSRTMSIRLIQNLTESSTRNEERTTRKADIPPFVSRLSSVGKVGALTAHNPTSLTACYTDNFHVLKTDIWFHSIQKMSRLKGNKKL